MFDDLHEIVAELVHYRELLVQLTLRDLRIRYKQTLIGFAWAVLIPAIVVASGWVLRTAFPGFRGELSTDAAMAAIAVKSIAWAFFIGALAFGTASLTTNIQLVTKVYFPRELLPLACVLTQLVDSGIAAIVLCVVLLCLGVGLSWGLLWLPVLVLLLIMLTTCAVLLLSCANVFYRDAKYLVQLIISFGIFFTPIFFNTDALGTTGAWLAMLNPLAPVLEGMRLVVVEGHDVLVPVSSSVAGELAWQPWYLAYSAVWAVGGLLAAALVFHRAEFVYAEYV